MADIFISHSVVDKELANYLCDSFEARGLSCWIAPRNIVPGTEWAESITQAISDCSVLLVIYSKNSMRSSQVAKEIGMADRKGKYIVPYKIDDTEPEGAFDYFLSCCQWVIARPEKGNYKIDEVCESLKNVVSVEMPEEVSAEVPVKKQEYPAKTDKKPSGNKRKTPAQKERARLMLGFGIGAFVLICLITGIIFAVSSANKDGEKADTANSGTVFDNLFTKDEDLYEYEVNEGYVTITQYIGTDSEVVIPDTLEGEPVKVLGEKIFYGRTDITSVVISEGVTEIPAYAFYKCSNLAEITIPDGVTNIGLHAFEGCTCLTTVELPDSVITIGDFAFNSCTNLTNVEMLQVEQIGMYAFATCSNLESVTLPDTLHTIGDMAFAYCTSLKEIHIPSGVEQYSENVFVGCEQIMIIPE